MSINFTIKKLPYSVVKMKETANLILALMGEISLTSKKRNELTWHFMKGHKKQSEIML